MSKNQSHEKLLLLEQVCIHKKVLEVSYISKNNSRAIKN